MTQPNILRRPILESRLGLHRLTPNWSVKTYERVGLFRDYRISALIFLFFF